MQRHTLNEARMLLPWLADRYRAITQLRGQLKVLNQQLAAAGCEALDPDFSVELPNASPHTLQLRARFRGMLDALHDEIAALVKRGCTIRQIEVGEVDVAGRTASGAVVFCWLPTAADFVGWHPAEGPSESPPRPLDSLVGGQEAQ